MAQERWIARFMLCIDRWIDRLNAGNLTRPYRITTNPSRRHIMFGIVQKPLSGERLHPDGQRWRSYDGPTYHQAKVMTESSPDDRELQKRLDMLVFKGLDTTVPAPQPQQVTEADVDRMVDAKVEAILKQKLNELVKNQAHQIARERTPPLPTGLQERPKKQSPKVEAAERDKLYELWKDRARLMGYTEPILTSQNQLHRNWLKAATYRWDEYCKTGGVPDSTLVQQG